MYFQEIPQIYYEFDVNGNRVLKVVRDITSNVRFISSILENVTLYDEYDIREGETPEIISDKYYGTSEYHWIIMLTNQRFDYLNDWPMAYHVFEQHVIDKYTLEGLGDTHHYVDGRGFIVMQDALGAMAVSNYDFESQLNESKRRIKLISPAIINAVVTEYKRLM